MKFGAYLPNCAHIAAITQPWEYDVSGRDIARVAQVAEDLGYWAVFVPEHFLIPRAHLEVSGEPEMSTPT